MYAGDVAQPAGSETAEPATAAGPLTAAERRRLPRIVALALLGYLATAAILATLVHASADLPDVTLFGRSWPLSEVHDVFFRYSVMGLVFVPAIFLIEIASVGWRRSSIRELLLVRPATGRSDAVCFVLVHLRLMRWPQIILTFGLALLSGELAREAVARWTGIELTLDWIPTALQAPCWFLLYTFFDYWAHRLDHTRVLWPLHRYHHSAEDFYVLTAARGHPAATLTQLVIKTFPLALLGVPMTAIIDVNILVAGINYLIHSRIEWNFGWFGRWVIASPLHHRLHHAWAFDGRARNFSVCPLWDRLFGTWAEPPYEPVRVGVAFPYRHGFWVVSDLLRDYRDFLWELVSLPWRAFRPRPVPALLPAEDAAAAAPITQAVPVPRAVPVVRAVPVTRPAGGP